MPVERFCCGGCLKVLFRKGEIPWGTIPIVPCFRGARFQSYLGEWHDWNRAPRLPAPGGEQTVSVMTEQERLLGILDSALTRFGRDAVRRLEQPLRRVAEAEEPQPTGDPLRYPHGLFIPELKSAPWHKPSWLPDAGLLEAAARDMREELQSLLESGQAFQPFDEGEYGFTPDSIQGAWNVYYIVFGCRELPEAVAACPGTAAALRKLPNLGMGAMFSALAPGTHLWPHCGPTNAVISLSLGLITPRGCTIRVGTRERTWRVGKCLVFDDTYEHEVWNRGKTTRFILLADAWHPELTSIEREILREVLKDVLWAPAYGDGRQDNVRTTPKGKSR